MLSFFRVQDAKWDANEGWNGNTLNFLSTREDPRVNAETENIVKTYSQAMELVQWQNVAFRTTFTTIKLVVNVICD
jgi:hypothetical protein